MRHNLWNLDNEWLNEFAEAFLRDTHRLVRDVAIDTDTDRVVVSGNARSYYAVQLSDSLCRNVQSRSFAIPNDANVVESQ